MNCVQDMKHAADMCFPLASWVWLFQLEPVSWGDPAGSACQGGLLASSSWTLGIEGPLLGTWGRSELQLGPPPILLKWHWGKPGFSFWGVAGCLLCNGSLLSGPLSYASCGFGRYKVCRCMPLPPTPRSWAEAEQASEGGLPQKGSQGGHAGPVCCPRAVCHVCYSWVGGHSLTRCPVNKHHPQEAHLHMELW